MVVNFWFCVMKHWLFEYSIPVRIIHHLKKLKHMNCLKKVSIFCRAALITVLFHDLHSSDLERTFKHLELSCKVHINKNWSELKFIFLFLSILIINCTSFLRYRFSSFIKFFEFLMKTSSYTFQFHEFR